MLNLEGNFNYGQFGSMPETVTPGSKLVLNVGSQGANITDSGAATLVIQGTILLAGRCTFSQSDDSSIVNSGTIIADSGASVQFSPGGVAKIGFAIPALCWSVAALRWRLLRQVCRTPATRQSR